MKMDVRDHLCSTDACIYDLETGQIRATGQFNRNANLNNQGRKKKIHTVILYNIPMSIRIVAKHGLGHDP
jgi:hypothetical protein